MKQISIFLENKPGTLMEMAQILSDNKINMRAASLTEAEGFGIMRVIVDDTYNASVLLKENGYVNKLTTVVVAMIPDEPGGLLNVLKIMAEGGVNVEYMYAFMDGTQKDAYMVFKVQDERLASKLLKEQGIKIVEGESI